MATAIRLGFVVAGILGIAAAVIGGGWAYAIIGCSMLSTAFTLGLLADDDEEDDV